MTLLFISGNIQMMNNRNALDIILMIIINIINFDLEYNIIR